MTTEPTSTAMSADQLLDVTRTLTLLVASDGTVRTARGGYGGFLGFDTDSLVGTNVFDFVEESEASQLATYFIENAGESPDTIAFPIPFRISVVSPDGRAQAVDIIPTGMRRTGGETQWVAVLVPVALFGSVTRSLDLEMEGAERSEVKRMLCEELAIDNASYTSRWVLVEFGDDGRVDVCTSRADDAPIAEAVRRDVVGGWTPWLGMEPSTVDTIAPSAVGRATLSEMDERGWQRAIVAPVHVRDQLAAVYLLVGRVPVDYLASTVTANVAARIEKLVRATELLIRRWETEDQLRLHAAHDPLTGLLNTRSLDAELANRPASGSILFVDVDHFKSVNDVFGHAVGDRVLTMIAGRVVAACRDDDLVARVGGDEFVIVLDGADERLAASIGGRIIEMVGAPLGLDIGPDAVTVSIGQAPFDGVGAVEAADHAMRLAKRTGRSRLAIATGD